MSERHDLLERREFLRRAVAAGTATMAVGSGFTGPAFMPQAEAAREGRDPSSKLNLAIVGVNNKGLDNLKNVSTENIVALVDIDRNFLEQIGANYPSARRYVDYREMFDKEKDLDGVVVSTPDHSHAIPTVMALKRGLDVYCEKPLAHSVWEVRQMREWAAKKHCVTQMGTQIHAGDNYRRAVEIVKAGIIGPVKRVHVWHDNSIRALGARVKEATPPKHVEYDLWLGAAPYRPYHESHFHFNWRYWFDFGGGILADMGCHYIDLPFWALDLRYPTTVEAHGDKLEGENDIPLKLRSDWTFPARGNLPPVHLTWYQMGVRPEGTETYGMSSCVLFEGEQGRLIADYGTHKLFLDKGTADDSKKQVIPKSIGHWAEWVDACKKRGSTTCNFDYSGALAESVLLGNVSWRVGQKKLEWDADSLTVRNNPDAAGYIRREYRKGWSLDG